MSSDRYTWVNGRVQDSIPVFDRGLAFGDGLFETMRVSRARVPLLDYHIERLLNGASELGISITESVVRRDVALALEQAAARQDNTWRLKYILTRGNSDSGYTPNPKAEPNRIMQMRPHDTGLIRLLQQQGVKTVSCQWRLSMQPALAGIKHLNRLDQVMARQELSDTDCFEGLMLDQNSLYIEGTMSNFFAVSRGDELVTPVLEDAGVNGIMRRLIMEKLCPGIDRVCHEAEIRRMDEFTELFISNAMIGIVPVTAVDDAAFAIGPVTRQLQQALQQSQLMP